MLLLIFYSRLNFALAKKKPRTFRCGVLFRFRLV